MNERWVQQGDRRNRRLSKSPLKEEFVRRQLSQLFGESLFGPWSQLWDQAGESWRKDRSRPWLWGLCLLVLLSACAFVAQWLVQPGLRHQADKLRDHYASELKTFIGDGDLERASEFARLVERHARGSRDEDLDTNDPYLDLLVASEAALYRYFDASPERLRRIRPHMDSRQSAPLRHIAALTVLSRGERAEKIREIEQLRNDAPDRNEIDYLLATAFEHRGEVRSSREAWGRSAKVEPAWLGHRFEQAWFELRQNRVEVARQIAADMLRVDPDSQWSKLAAEHFSLPRELQIGSIRGDAAVPATTPVQIHFQRLTQALFAAGHHELSRAKQRLAEAVAAIQHQPAFLLDAFDWCIGENQPVLARELTEMPQWPRNSETAKAMLDRLSRAEAGRPSLPLLAPSTETARAASSERVLNDTQLTR